jgi:hypothetical protein
MPEEGRIDRRYCRPGCRTLAYRMRLRTRGIEHGPTAVPRWAAGRLPELAQALTTLGRVQGNVTVLARQMECEEAAVRAWLLRLRALGEDLPDTPVPDPQARLRSETERLREDLDEALAQRNKLDEELRAHKDQISTEIAKLRREAEEARKPTQKAEKEQPPREQEEVLRLHGELAKAQAELKAKEDRLRAAEQERASLRDEKVRAEQELLALRVSKRRRTPTQEQQHHANGVSETATPVPPREATPPHDPARDRMDEQIANIRLAACLNYLAMARAQGKGEQVQDWLSRNSLNIHQAAQVLGRTIPIARMGQDVGIPIAQAAKHAYQQALEHVRTPRARATPEFCRWFQESESFLLKLAEALLAALDARSSTNQAPVQGTVRPLLPSRAAPQGTASSQTESLAPRRNEQPLPVPLLESVMPRAPRIDPLTNLMRDKVQLLHMLAEHQEERGEKITGTLLEPMNETTVLVAARQAAREARREFYFRSRGVLSAIDPNWELEGEQLDTRSEKALFAEVMDLIDLLKKAVDKVKPKGDPW